MEAEYLPKRRRLLEIPARVSTNSKSDRCPWFGFRYPVRLPEEGASYNQPFAKSLLPPGAYIWEARTGRAWAGHFPPHKRISCAWTVWGGNREAMLAAVAMLWQLFLKDKGLKPDQCPIPGLPEVG